MKLILIIISSILVFMHTIGAQNAPLKVDSRVLLEAHYSSKGMLSWRDGSHLIARIYNNGTVEYEDVEVKKGVSNSYFRHTTLSQEELQNISAFLKSKEVQNLSSRYAAFTTTIDHSEDLIIKIINDDQIKEIKVDNFKPDVPKVASKYPKSLLHIACWAEIARKNTETRFFFRDSQPLCCKCL